MEKEIEDKLDLKDKLINFYNLNRYKIYIFLLALVLSLVSLIYINHINEKKNILISKKYVRAGLLLSSNDKDSAKKLYEEIITSKNKFYSILALNVIVEKELILDKEKILKYFKILESSVSSKDQRDLIILKKALYLIKIDNVESGYKLLNKLIEDNSILKSVATKIIKK